MKQINIILLSLLISMSVMIQTAKATLTGTWSDATKTFNYNEANSSGDYLEWTDGTKNNSDRYWGTVYTQIATPSTSTFVGHIYDHVSWSFSIPNRPCQSASGSIYFDENDNRNGSATPTVFPIISVIPEGSSGGPSDVIMHYLGTWIESRRLVINGIVDTNNSYTITHLAEEWNDTLLGSRGNENCTASQPRTDFDYPGDPEHSGYSKSSLNRQLSSTIAYQVSYTGRTNTYAVLDWNFTPLAVLRDCEIPDEDYAFRTDRVNSGASAGPGAQMVFPSESVQLVFLRVVDP